jgi:hypothetical protein
MALTSFKCILKELLPLNLALTAISQNLKTGGIFGLEELV